MEKSKIYIALLSVLACFLLHGCTDDANEPKETNEPRVWNLNPEDLKVIACQNSLGIELLTELASAEDVQHNVLISPLSAALDLGLVAQALDENSQSKVAGLLGAENLSEIANCHQHMNHGIAFSNDAIKFETNNSVWFNQPFVDNQSSEFRMFSDNAVKFYNSEQFTYDFGVTEMSKQINDWCKTKTNGLITAFYKDEFSLTLAMVIANATYFEGKWAAPFDIKETKDDNFYDCSGEISAVTKMMHQTTDLNVTKLDNGIVIELFYKGCLYDMNVILPNDGISPAEFLAKAGKNLFNEIKFGKSRLYEVDLSMPKFEIESSVTVSELLKIKGVDINTAYCPFAPFGGDILISQQSKIKVDEEGTVVAAVTATQGAIANYVDGKMKIEVNRPFIFFITERGSQCILFAGIVNRP